MKSTDMFPEATRTAELEAVAIRAIELYTQRHPRPVHVTIKQAAEMLDLNRNTVGRMVSRGDLTLDACGMIPINQVDALLRAVA
jgi:predicted DNA-binding protein (UPF0251 family)